MENKSPGRYFEITWLCSGQASDAVSAYTQVELKDAPELLHLSEEDCPKIWIRLPKARRLQQWDSIDDPVLPVERNLCGHPLAGLLWERNVENVLFEEGWESVDGGALTSSQNAVILVGVC